MIFSSLTPRCNSSKSSSAMVLPNRLAGGRLLPLLRVRLEDLAILRRLKARYQLQVCNHNQRIQRFKLPRILRADILVNHLLHAFSVVLRTLLHETRGREAPEGECSKRNTPLKACSNYYLLILCAWSQIQTHKVWTADQCVALVSNGNSSNYWMLPT